MSLELLLTEFKDPYVRENFRRIRDILRDLDSRVSDSATSGDVINNIIANSVWKKINTNADASTTTTIDQINLNDFFTLKYIISIRDNTNNKTTTVELTVKNENGSLVDTVFAKLSGGISFALDAVNDSGLMKLNLQNNEAVGLTIGMARLTL